MIVCVSSSAILTNATKLLNLSVSSSLEICWEWRYDWNILLTTQIYSRKKSCWSFWLNQNVTKSIGKLIRYSIVWIKRTTTLIWKENQRLTRYLWKDTIKKWQLYQLFVAKGIEVKPNIVSPHFHECSYLETGSDILLLYLCRFCSK